MITQHLDQNCQKNSTVSANQHGWIIYTLCTCIFEVEHDDHGELLSTHGLVKKVIVIDRDTELTAELMHTPWYHAWESCGSRFFLQVFTEIVPNFVWKSSKKKQRFYGRAGLTEGGGTPLGSRMLSSRYPIHLIP